MVAAALPGASATLYCAEAGGLRLAAATTSRTDGTPEAWIAATDALYRGIVGDARSLSVLDREAEARLGVHGLVAVPVFADAGDGSATQRRVVGMIKIEAVAPAALNDTLPAALSAIGDAFAPALAVRLGNRLPAVARSTPAVVPLAPPQKFWRHLRWFRAGTADAADEAPPQEAATNSRASR